MSLGESACAAQRGGGAVKRVQWVAESVGGMSRPVIEVTSYMKGGSSVNEAALPA